MADSLDPDDLLARWMAYHLAELVTAAESDATVEQQSQIVDTILRIWTHRQYLRPPPMGDFTSVLAALDRLGDTSPWAYSRLSLETLLPDSAADAALVNTAVELERLTRETLLRLIWLAAQDASDATEAWLTLSDQIEETLESRVSSTLRRRRLATDKSEEAGLEFDGDPADDSVAIEARHVSDEAHADNLRAMARLLNRLAEQLAPTVR